MDFKRFFSLVVSIFTAGILFWTSPAFAKSLTVYFSKAGENYSVGEVQDGNTARLAKLIAKTTGSDIAEIIPENEYPMDIKTLTEVSKQEFESKARPVLKDNPDISGYDEIYLGTPVWWADMPMVVYTFLESQDFKGKTIHPFITHEGMGLSAIDRKIAEVTGAKVGPSLVMRGTMAQKADEETQSHVDEWLKQK